MYVGNLHAGGCLQVLPPLKPIWQHMPSERLVSMELERLDVKHGTGEIVSYHHSIAPHAPQLNIANRWLVGLHAVWS